MNTEVQILMSVYHGEKYIEKQLDSIINQKGVNPRILIRIDGHNDPTRIIIERYKREYDFIDFFEGDNIGYAKSFWELLSYADAKCEYYAFCDQDDIWDYDKLYSAVKMIEYNDNDNVPKLYTSKVCSVDNNMKIINNNTFNTSKKLTFYESLLKSKFPGCVFVFNREALKYLKRYNGFMESHDWIAYLIVNLFGEVFYDDKSHIKYRIHGNNAIGKNNNLKDFFLKIKRFFSKSKRVRSKMAQDIYKTFGNEISSEILNDIFQLGFYSDNILTKVKLLFNRNFKGIIFRILVIFNKM